MASFLRRLAAGYSKLLREQPYKTNFATGGTLAAFGDVVCQTVVEDNDRFDWQRLGALATFGCCYNGHVSLRVYQAYYKFLPSWAMSSPARQALACTSTDNLVHSPFLYTPAFYLVTGVLQGQSLREAKAHLEEMYWPTLTTLWKVWVPLQAINFGLIPQANRVVFTNTCCVAWNIIIDFIAHSGGEEHAAQGPNAQDQAGTLAIKGEQKPPPE